MKPTPTAEQAKAKISLRMDGAIVIRDRDWEKILVIQGQQAITALLNYDQLKAQNQVLREALLRCITDLELAHGGRDTLTLIKARAALATT